MYNKNKPLASIAESQYKLAKKLQDIEEYEMPKFYKFDQLKLMQSIASSQKIIVEKYNPEPGPEPPTPPTELNYFYVENAVPKSINNVVISNEGHSDFNLEYSYDKEEWIEIESDEYEVTIDFEDRVYLRGKLSDLFTRPNRIRIDCKTFFNVGGNILSLIYGYEFTGDEISVPNGVTFYGMFEGKFGTYGYEIHLISAKNLILPIQVLSESMYRNMFLGCNELTEAPELPATTLADDCYRSMFANCTSLTNAPELPATILAEYCYGGMFDGCISLTEAPELPATKLVDGCYFSMFKGCTSLKSVTVYVTGEWNRNYTNMWLMYVAKTGGTLYNLGGATGIPEQNESGCPEGWTIETELPQE